MTTDLFPSTRFAGTGAKPPTGPTGAVVIESRRRTAGLALPGGPMGGVQFFASDTLFQVLDGRRFRSIRALERAVDTVEESLADRARGRDSRGQIWRSWQRPTTPIRHTDGDDHDDGEPAAA